MAGLSGRAGWSWIFVSPLVPYGMERLQSTLVNSCQRIRLTNQIMMGVITCIAAVVGYLVVPNFPAKATFLNAEEAKLVSDRINTDRHDFEDEALSLKTAAKHLTNWRIWS